MRVRIHPHAAGRMPLRGVSAEEIVTTIQSGERFPAKHGRTGFRHDFKGAHHWRGREFDTKRVEVYAVWEDEAWLAITLISKYF